MPFKSKAQARFMFAKKPEMAKEWAAATPSIKALPNKVSSRPVEKTRPMDMHEARKHHR